MCYENSDFKTVFNFIFSIDKSTSQNSLNTNLNMNSCSLPFKLNYSHQNFSQDFNSDKTFNNSSNYSNDENYAMNLYSGLFDLDLEDPDEDSSIPKLYLTDNCLSQNYSNNNKMPFPKINIQKKGENKKIFSIIKEIKGHNTNDNKKYLFSNVTNHDNKKREIKDIKKKGERFEHPRKRYKNTDLILKKITTSFINKYLIKAINKKSNKIFFDNANLELIKAITYKKDKDTNLNMTLKQLFKKANLYKKQFDLLEKEKNKEIEEILNTTYFDLFKEYIHSDEFKIKEINRLKKKARTSEEWYIDRYIYLSENFFEYITKKK